MKLNKAGKSLLIALSIILAATICIPETAEAASAKAVKSVSLKIGTQKVTKKTYTMQKGKTATLKVTVSPSKAKKSVTYKSSSKTIATVSSKGKITAKKTGTAKITVTVKGKNGKKKTTYVKIKVVKAHKHSWQNITQQKYVVDERAWDEDVYKTMIVCTECDFVTSLDDLYGLEQHQLATRHANTIGKVKVGTIHHDEKGHNETVVVDRKCKICGVLDSQL